MNPDLAREALGGLLNEFRHGNIVAPSAERQGMQRHAGALSARWNERFPGFPAEHFPYASLRGVRYRNRRDAHLKDIIVRTLAGRGRESIIVNPACVFGRHARQLAVRLPHVRVIATDIDPRYYRSYRTLRFSSLPANLSFVKDSIFEPELDVQPTAVVFFGACGALSDGALDYAIASGATYVMCRTCCHDNIGGNLTITARPSTVNRLFRCKNWVYGRIRRMPRYTGFYFSPNYMPSAYPRSAAGKHLCNPDEYMAVARNSADSDICRAIIDLDRFLHLLEQGFDVEYRGDLLVAERSALLKQPSIQAPFSA